MRIDFFVDPACLWTWLTSRWLVEVAPQRNLDIQWRTYSLLLDGTQGLKDWKVAIRTASHRATRVMQALRRDDPAAVPRFYEALLPRTFAAVNAGGPPFAELEGALVAAGLAPSYAVAADDAAFDEPIRQSMAEAFAAAGGPVGTPTIVLHQDPPVGFLGPVLAAPPTGTDALASWDAVVALAAVPGVLVEAQEIVGWYVELVWQPSEAPRATYRSRSGQPGALGAGARLLTGNSMEVIRPTASWAYGVWPAETPP